jgi:hypothetical protein
MNFGHSFFFLMNIPLNPQVGSHQKNKALT